MPPASRPPDATAALVRMALLAGVLLFGAVSWYVQRSPDWTPATDVRAFRNAGFVPWTLAVVGVVVLKLRLDRVRDEGRRRALNLLGWTCGQTVALYGAVVYYNTGEPSWYLLGLVFMLGTFVVFPLRRA